ncbi:MAG: hypothetical protein ACK5DD_05995 [Cyclobacteriaceae bacterium]|jgi:hypothetical protein
MKKAILVLGLVLYGLRGLSCTCFDTPTDSAFVYTPIIFEGKVVSQYKDVFFYEEAEYSLITNFEIIKDYRGTRGKKIITLVGGFGCNFFFETGETYIVFAYRRAEGIYSSSFCSKTRLKSEFQSNDLNVIDVWSKRYYDNFNLTYQILLNKKSRAFEKAEPERILRLAYLAEKKAARLYKFAFVATVLSSITCIAFILFYKRSGST